MHPAKRRRVDTASFILCKPFRSPLKVSNNECQPLLTSQKDNHVQQAPSCASPFRNDLGTTVEQGQTSLTDHSTIPETISTSTDDVVVLQKHCSSLTLQLRKLRQELDVTEQALKIQSNIQKIQLEALMLKWRDIARDAADDVLAAAQSRVKDMGGMKAWQNNALHSASIWDDAPTQEQCKIDDEEHGGLDEGSEEQGRERDAEEEEQDHSLTMTMMLRQMNIDSKLLRFDEDFQQWIT